MGEAAAVASGERDPREYLVDVNDVGCEFDYDVCQLAKFYQHCNVPDAKIL